MMGFKRGLPWRLPALIAAGLLFVGAGWAAAQAPDDERVRRLEAEVAALRSAIEELRTDGRHDSRLAEIERRLEILAEEVENLKVGDEAALAIPDEFEAGLGPAASKVYRVESGLSIGGYGEMLLERFDSERDDGSTSGRTDRFDFLRGVVYVGYKLSDAFVLNTEFELEHASTSEGGSVSVEFAYLDYLHSPALTLRAGLLLLPMGFVNELHEPTVFLGARRSETEQRIIPSTWRENGAGVVGEFGGFSYRSYFVTGLDASGFSAGGLRGGRQKGASAKAEDFAWVGRLDLTAVPGFLAGASVYAGNSGQGLEDPSGASIDVPTVIAEVHADYRWRGLELRGLYAHAELDEVDELNRALGLEGGASVGETMAGGYLQAGFDLLAARAGRAALIPYLRWERINTQEEVPDGYLADPATDIEVLTLGLAYQPIEQLILKLDYQDVDNGAGSAVDQLNLGLGYIF